MSFSINTNTMAMNAMNNLDNVNMELSTSMNRLSTGLQINSAADNPAGFITAQEMNAQIGGMGQALQNTQEAINYAKTAEGAFTTVNSLLNSARTLAVAAANTSTQTGQEIQADQQQLNSIAASITQIAQTTEYNGKNLLNGSSGVQAAVTAGNNIAALNIGGTYANAALTANSTVTLNSLTAATQATITSAGFATLATAVPHAGSFSINGTTFSASASNTAGDLINMINAQSNLTGVVASYTGAAITLNSVGYGSANTINLVDANGVIRNGGAGSSSASGTDAVGVLDVNNTVASFTGGLNGYDGLTLSDANGNTFTVTSAGNVTTAVAAAIGQVIVGSSQFQIGANSGQTAQLSLGNFAASQIGNGAVAGLNLSNLDLTTATGASNAIKVIDQAIQQVSVAQGNIGNFQTNVLQANVSTLTSAQTNLAASLSTIQDTNVAAEMTNFTKLQILEQSGMSILGQANQLPQNILSLIKNG